MLLWMVLCHQLTSMIQKEDTKYIEESKLLVKRLSHVGAHPSTLLPSH